MKIRIFTMFTAIIIMILPFNLLAQDNAAKPQPETDERILEDKISLDIKGMDIVDVLKILAMRSGINMVVGKNVVGKVTIFLKDVRPRQALNIIVLANGFAYEEYEGIITIMTGRDYEARFGEKFADKKETLVTKLKYAKASTLVAILNQIKSKIGKVVVDDASNTVVLMDTPDKLLQMRQVLSQVDRPTETRVFDINYSNSGKLENKIQEMLTKNIGSINADERTNKIIVSDYPEKIKKIAELIKAFDSRTRQVLIDSKIVEITLNDKLELGINWEYWIKKNLKIGNAFPLSLSTGGTVTIGTTTTVDETGEYMSIIKMLNTIGDTRVLSSPRVTALNNEEAKILVGTREAYITQTTSQSGSGATITAESVNFVDVGIQLYVTPRINKEGFVTMKIKPVVSSATRTEITSGGTISEIPIVSTSEAETSVMVKDGATIIIAGLIKDEVIQTVNKIPFLGDIPILGHLFKSTNDEVKRKELVIFLTPHILSSSLAEAKPSALEFEESLEFLDRFDKPEVDNILFLDIEDKEPSPESSQADLDLSYSGYISRLREIIAEQSTKLVADEHPLNGEVEISFLIAKDGRLKTAPEIISASDDLLRDYALKAVIASVPFPPFPQDISAQEKRFNIVISYSMQ